MWVEPGREEYRQRGLDRSHEYDGPVTATIGGSRTFTGPPNDHVVKIHAGDEIEVERDKDGKLVHFRPVNPRLPAPGPDATRTDTVK